MRKNVGIAVAVGFCICSLLGTKALAVPELGVGSSFGYVNANTADPYQTYWGGSLPGPADEDGFAIGPSGSALHVFTNIASADIYILTTADVGTGNSINFNGSVSLYDVEDPFRSYEPIPYYGTNLGKVGGGWSPLPSDPFTPGNFYSFDVTVNYTGTLTADNWIFAAADDNGLAGLQTKNTTMSVDDNGLDGIQDKETIMWVDSNLIGGIQEKGGKIKIVCPTDKKGCWVTYEADTFKAYSADTFTTYHGDSSSPKTTSARGGFQVPEPASLLLLGSGFLGLGILRRRRNS